MQKKGGIMNTIGLTDQELIRKYLQGQESAFEKLLNRHKDRVFSYIYYTVKDEEVANDVFQDTFVKVIQTLKKGKYNDEGKFLPWVMRIAHNLMIDYFRKNSKMPTVKGNDDFDVMDMLTSKDKGINEKLEIKQHHKLIKSLIKDLPADQKEVLMMRLYYDMSFKEIAASTNVSINTALGRMRYALINLRKMIQERNIPVSV